MRASYPLIIHGNIPHRVRHRDGPAPLVTYLVGNRYQRPKACGQLPRSDSAASLLVQFQIIRNSGRVDEEGGAECCDGHAPYRDGCACYRGCWGSH